MQHKVQHEGASAEEAGGGGAGWRVGGAGGGEGEEAAGDAARSKAAIFSKVLCIGSLCNDSTRALTFEDFRTRLGWRCSTLSYGPRDLCGW